MRSVNDMGDAQQLSAGGTWRMFSVSGLIFGQNAIESSTVLLDNTIDTLVSIISA